jgi:superfamily II DNA or RNA helicase
LQLTIRWIELADESSIITTWQTLGRPERMKEFKERFEIADFKLVVVDEAHHSAADS